MQDTEKEFKPTSWSIDNKVVIYVITAMICLAGVMTYNSLPKENFPEVVFPQIYVAMTYQGAPEDLENLISKEIEKEVVAIAGVKKVTSNSFQNYAMVLIEFQTDVDVKAAKRDVQDAVDRASRELPNDRLNDPEVFEVDISEVPIMFINLSGDFDLQTLKRYAEDMEDEIEGLKEIRRVDIVGALDREIQVNLDMFKVAQAGITPFDIGQAISAENSIIAGGEVKVDGMKRSISVNGEFATAEQIANLVIVSTKGGKVLLKDVAQVVDTHKEQESYSRLDEKNVISLNVVKRGGENLIDASDKINAIVKDFQDNKLPKGLEITITGDQSDSTRMTLHDLINTIIIGFVLVTIILMFFMGATNAIFVGLSVPISSFIAFLVFPVIGFSLNLMTLFSFLLALGIVVDDAIVVIENTHRVFDNGKVPIRKAAKIAAGEVFLPVLSGTLVVLAPFIPLAFWPGVIGSFMMYLPITLIVALLASLVVAYIMNPVFAADFMRPHDHHSTDSKVTKGYKITAVIFISLAVIFYAMQVFGLANFVLFIFGIYSLHRFVLEDVISKFQTKAWPYVQDGYRNWIAWFLEGSRPWLVVGGIAFLFVFSIVFTAMRSPKLEFFPTGDPHFIYAYVRMPIGTDQRVTDSVTNIVEDRIIKAIGTDTAIVESIISNVAVNAAEDPFSGAANQPHLGKVSVAFVEYAERNGRSSKEYLSKIRAAVKGVKGAEISVDQEQGGPPTGKPINIEIAADDFTALVSTADRLKRYLDSLQIAGVEELKSDFQSDKPEISIKIDREKANREGISTRDIGMLLATSIYGNETSRFRDVNDDYPIQIRVADHQRNDINTLMNIPVTYRDMASGGIVRQVPLSAIAKIEYSNSFASIKRIDQKRVISLSSNVLTDYNPNEVVGNIQKAIDDFRKRDDVEIKMTGEQEDQAETTAFLGNAALIALGLILIILVIQFNSVSKPVIILSEIVLSIIGVLIGFSLFNMTISIVMTGVGLMALAGIVVRNGILLVEFTDLLISQGVELKAAIIEASRTRMTPVLLTAMAATLGLIPLAVGLNIDFVKLFTELNPNIFFGGDNVAFWGPLSWTMIFGLIFGTFLTLFFVPVMYLITARWKEALFGKAKAAEETESKGSVASA